MSGIKDLFSKGGPPGKHLSLSDLDGQGREVAESAEFVNQFIEEKNRFIPQVDYKEPVNFARYGSAEQYYSSSVTKIHNTWPYDGSRKEKLEWLNSSSYLDLHIFENEYPRTTGYITLGNGGWGTQSDTETLSAGDSLTVGLSNNIEYIQIKGGPHGDENYDSKKISQIFPGTIPTGSSNIYDVESKRVSNLQFKAEQGVTIEFWMKKTALASTSLTHAESIFSLWNGEPSASSGLGRYDLFLVTTGSNSEGVLHFGVHSGSTSWTDSTAQFTSVTKTEAIDGLWHHYAVTLKNSGDDLISSLYFDGVYQESVTGSSKAIEEVTGSLIANIGAFRTVDNSAGQTGYGKLSASLDEFRYWKTERSATGIGRYRRSHVDGGANTDNHKFSGSINPVDLGVYYKFNEGITGTGSHDSIILDYSGRVSNGAWTGYSVGARITGSAMVESGVATKEFKDPILYSFHPDVKQYFEEKTMTGSAYDSLNLNSIYSSIPQWIREEDDQLGGQTVMRLTQIIASYFDNLHLQIEALPRIKDVNQLTGSISTNQKPVPFSDKLVSNYGFVIPEIFGDANVLQQLDSRSEEIIYKDKLHNVKNSIYQNIYSNLLNIYKSKGTEKAFRNLFRCYGIDDEILKINLYGDNITHEFLDNYRPTVVKKHYVNFNINDSTNITGSYTDNFTGITSAQIVTASHDAVVYQMTSSNNSNSVAFISGSTNLPNSVANTLEAEIIFPKTMGLSALGKHFESRILTSSLFGIRQANEDSSGDTTWAYWSDSDAGDASISSASFSILSLREALDSEDARFQISSSYLGLDMTSSVFKEVYDNKRWNFAVRIKPAKYPWTDQLSGTLLFNSDETIFFETTFASSSDGTATGSLPTTDWSETGSTATDPAGWLAYSGNTDSEYTGPSGSYDGEGYYMYAETSSPNHPDKIFSLRTSTIDAREIDRISGSFYYHMYGADIGLLKVQASLHEGFNSDVEDVVDLSINWDGTDATQIVGQQQITSGSAWKKATIQNEESGIGDFAGKEFYLRFYYRAGGNYRGDAAIDQFKLDGFVEDERYDVQFIGVNVAGDDVVDEFTLTASLTQKVGTSFMSNAKRVYVGANRQDFTGSVLHQCDTKISSCRYWMTYLPDEVIRYHAKDSANFGTESPYRNAYLFQESVGNFYLPEAETLALHWDFTTNTGSDDSGMFVVEDLSSGSATFSSDHHDWLTDILKRQHTGLGVFFPADNSEIIQKRNILSSKRNLPESIHSGDMIRILTKDDEVFMRTTRPVEYYFAIEKSMYQTISEQMLNLFATITDFNNLIGEPVNRYRQDYKALGKLRQLFFDRIGNTPDLDKYVEYYKWIDGSMMKAIEQLIPISAYFSEDLNTVVESHVLERNKYWTKFPTSEDKLENFDISSSLKGINELLYDWKFGHASPPSTDLVNDDQNENCLWWNHRAERDQGGLSSGDSDIDDQRETIRRISVADLSGSTYALRTARPYKLSIDRHRSLHGGTNFERPGIFKDLQSSYLRSGGQSKNTEKVIVISSSLVELDSRTGNQKDIVAASDRAVCNQKRDSRLKIKAKFAAGFGDSSDQIFKGELILPFNLYSSSLKQGYTKAIRSTTGMDVNIVNLHHDTPQGYMPLQGPFTNEHVGGSIYRHQKTPATFGAFTSSEGISDRAEQWKIELSNNNIKMYGPYGLEDASGSAGSRVPTYRDGHAKRPLNIQNIKYGTASHRAGNYRFNYEIVQTTSRATRRMQLDDAATPADITSSVILLETDSPTTAPSSGTLKLVDYELPIREKTESVFVSRFSAPGGPETMAEGMMDLATGELSPYNALPWRNLTVRKPLQMYLSNSTAQFGRFFDKTHDASQDGRANFHKVHRNTRYVLRRGSTTQTGEEIVSSSVKDNAFISHPIPQSDLQYAWITASAEFISSANGVNFPIGGGVLSSSAHPFGYQQPDIANPGLASSDIVFVASSSVGMLIHKSSDIGYFGFPIPKEMEDDYDYQAVDFAGMNTILVDPLSSSTNTIGHGQGEYVNQPYETTNYVAPVNQIDRHFSEIITYWIDVEATHDGNENTLYGRGIEFTLQGLLSHRGSVYGWPSWKQVRVAQHPIARYHRKHNVISVRDNPDGQKMSGLSNLQDFKPRGNSQTQFNEPAITMRYKPLEHSILFDDQNGDGEKAILVYTHGNELAAFTSKENFSRDAKSLNEALDYGPGFPGYRDTSQLYEDLTNLYINADPLDPGNPIQAFDYIEHKDTIFPSDRFATLAKVRGRTNYTEKSGLQSNPTGGYDREENRSFWRDNAENRIRTHDSAINSMGYVIKRDDRRAQAWCGFASAGEGIYRTYKLWSNHGRFPDHGGGPWSLTASGYQAGNDDGMATGRTSVEGYTDNKFPNAHLYTNSDSQQSGSWPSTPLSIFVFDQAKGVLPTTGGYGADPDWGDEELEAIGQFSGSSVGELFSTPYFSLFAARAGNASIPESDNFSALSSSGLSILEPNAGRGGTTGSGGGWSPGAFWSGEEDNWWNDEQYTSDPGAGDQEQIYWYSTGSAPRHMPATASVQYMHMQKLPMTIIRGERLGSAEYGISTNLTLYDDFWGIRRTEKEALLKTGIAKKPWYDTYGDFASDVRFMGQDYSIIPEFRVSDHMEYYLNVGKQGRNQNFLSLDGGQISQSADDTPDAPGTLEHYTLGFFEKINETSVSETEFDLKVRRAENKEFFTTFAHTDFINHFEVIKTHHKAMDLPPYKMTPGPEGLFDAEKTFIAPVGVKNLKLTCHGIKKLLPYKGFYPADRTVQLASLFRKSYLMPENLQSGSTYATGSGAADVAGNGFAASPHDISASFYPAGYTERLQTMLQPFFAPGIMYNTIKSGIAVDWPTYKNTPPGAAGGNKISSYGQTAERPTERAITGSIEFGILSGNVNQDPRSRHNYRLPFEALYEPHNYLPKRFGGQKLFMTHPSWGLTNFHASWDGGWDERYYLAMNNFLAESVRFFLEKGQLTTHTSVKQGDVILTKGTTYYMDVVLRKTNKFQMFEGPRSARELMEYVAGNKVNPSGSNGHEVFYDMNMRDNLNSSSYRGIHYGPACQVLDKYNPLSSSFAATGDATASQIPIVDVLAFETGSTIRNFGSFNHNIRDPAFAPYTPPYFYGEAIARVVLRTKDLYPDIPRGQKFSVPMHEIIEDCKTFSGRNGGIFSGSYLEGDLDANPRFPFYHDNNIIRDYAWDANETYTSERDGTVLIGTGNHFGTVLAEASGSGFLAGVSRMPVSSSVNLFAKAQILNPDNPDPRNPEKYARWAIHPKFECPSLNFHPASFGSSSAGGSGSVVTNGMWLGYGVQPAAGQGIYLELRDSFGPGPYQAVEKVNIDESDTLASDSTTIFVTGSFLTNRDGGVKLFDPVAKRVGDIAESRTISEAVIAIPFFTTRGRSSFDDTFAAGGSSNAFYEYNNRFFLPLFMDTEGALTSAGWTNFSTAAAISKALVQKAMGTLDINAPMPLAPGWAYKPGSSISNMVTSLQKYVLPPQFDFINNPEITPFHMYVFNFEHTLNKEDLSDIWQGLMPKIGRVAEKQSVTIEHNTIPLSDLKQGAQSAQLPIELFTCWSEHIDWNSLQWLVFKVKQRAEASYADVTVDSTDDINFLSERSKLGLGANKKLPFSYNWPYDFCSLVELGKIESTARLAGGDIIPAKYILPSPSEVITTTAEIASVSEATYSPEASYTTADLDLKSATPQFGALLPPLPGIGPAQATPGLLVGTPATQQLIYAGASTALTALRAIASPALASIPGITPAASNLPGGGGYGGNI